MAKFKQIYLRELKLSDLDDFYMMKHPSRKFHAFNGPYFKQTSEVELKEYIEKLRVKLMNNENSILEGGKIIADKASNKIVGQVNWYWKSRETNWMEIGLVIFNEDYWGYGIGYDALRQWTEEIFQTYPELIRLGLTTWSGNERMMKLAEKVGFVKEATYRKARIVNGTYYDSVSYGVLKEEWLARQ